MIRKTLIASLFLLVPIAGGGCATDPIEPAEGDAVAEETVERGPIGKADHYGQCMEIDIKYCGGQSSGNCWCDDQCDNYGDCCSDYQSECVDDGPSCDPNLFCGQAITCVDGQYYPTTCGPGNCDAPMGPCGEPEVTCGGFAGTLCGEGEYCSFAAEATCGWADATGTCEDMPELCGQNYSPVCGCNGNNYSNECMANAAGTSVKQTGDCECQPGYAKQWCWGQSQCVPLGAQC